MPLRNNLLCLKRKANNIYFANNCQSILLVVSWTLTTWLIFEIPNVFIYFFIWINLDEQRKLTSQFSLFIQIYLKSVPSQFPLWFITWLFYLIWFNQTVNNFYWYKIFVFYVIPSVKQSLSEQSTEWSHLQARIQRSPLSPCPFRAYYVNPRCDVFDVHWLA